MQLFRWWEADIATDHQQLLDLVVRLDISWLGRDDGQWKRVWSLDRPLAVIASSYLARMGMGPRVTEVAGRSASTTGSLSPASSRYKPTFRL